jgi:hypothetical protein
MRRHIVRIALCTGLFAGATALARAAAPPTAATSAPTSLMMRAVSEPACLPTPADPDDDFVLWKLRDLVSDSSAAGVAMRTRWQLPLAAETELVAVNDEAICSTARTAYNAGLLPTQPVEAVRVFRLRDRYIVKPPEATAGEWSLFMVFDTTFSNRLAQVLG